MFLSYLFTITFIDNILMDEHYKPSKLKGKRLKNITHSYLKLKVLKNNFENLYFLIFLNFLFVFKKR